MEAVVNTIGNLRTGIKTLDTQKIVKKTHSAASNQTNAPAPLATSQPFVKTPPEPVKPVVQSERMKNSPENNQESIDKNLPATNTAISQTIKRFEFVHDEQSGLSVVKFFDSKGNVIMQVPPEQYLKIVQMLTEFGGMNLQAGSANPENSKITGLLLDKKV